MSEGEYGSYYDKDTPRSVEIKEVGIVNVGFILILVTAIILSLFYSWLFYAFTLSIVRNQIYYNTPVAQCAPGECVMDTLTGEKICPNSIESYAYNVSTQVCVSPYICNTNIMRYALNSDGSTNSFGICEENPVTGIQTQCRCMKLPSCPFYTAATFVTTIGSAYTSLLNSRTTFAQNLTPEYTTGPNLDSVNRGVTVTNPVAEFCQVPMEWIFRTTPGCAGLIRPSSAQSSSNFIEDTQSCFNSKPCMRGTLAFIVDNASEFNYGKINYYPVACVGGQNAQPGNSCPPNSVTLFDRSYGDTVCYSES